MVDSVILAGTVGREAGWTRGQPRPLLPLPGTSLIEALVAKFRAKCDGACLICANGNTDVIARRLARYESSHPAVGFFEDRLPRGTAGCLKSCEPQLRGGRVFVTGGSVWLEDDPAWMLEQHGKHGNALTVFCTRDPEIGGLRRESLLRPAGVYCCDPAVLGLISTVGYQDLKEQLIPALRKAGLRVGAVTLNGSTCEVTDWQTYLQVLHRVISMGSFETDGYQEAAPGVWLGEDVDVAPEARIVGPAILGRGCRIDANSVVIGPAILGNDCHVANRAWLIRVVAADFTRVLPGAAVTDRFLASREDRIRVRTRRSTVPSARVLPSRWRSSEALVPGLTLLGASVWGWGSAVT